jgi:hypothetical protein
VRREIFVVAGSVVGLAALVYPAIAPNELDSLPFSNYPMFAHPRGEVTHFNVVVGVDADGVEQPLDLRVVGGTDQPIQASETVRQAVRRGEAEELCAEIAARVEGHDVVRVVTLGYDAVGWYEGDREPVRRDVHAECAAGDGR